jgi:hypothetical protein
MEIVVFHSMWGLRPVEMAAAERLRLLGYQVSLPDLFSGRTAPGEIEAGFALIEEIGWSTITGRAYDALSQVSDDAAMIGFSMGVGVTGQVWDSGAVAFRNRRSFRPTRACRRLSPQRGGGGRGCFDSRVRGRGSLLHRSVDQIPGPRAMPGGSRYEVKWDGYLH